MGSRYDFWITKIDYTVTTKSGAWGTDSKLSLQVLRRTNINTWDVISDAWVEPGSTDRLNAGREESFSRTFPQPVGLTSSDDAQAYREMVRFRFKIYGGDAWSPSDIQITPTFMYLDRKGTQLPTPLVETLDYNPNTWILSTDPADGTSKDKDGNPTTLTLSY